MKNISVLCCEIRHRRVEWEESETMKDKNKANSHKTSSQPRLFAFVYVLAMGLIQSGAVWRSRPTDADRTLLDKLESRNSGRKARPDL